MSKKKKTQLEPASKEQAVDMAKAEEAPAAIVEEPKVDFDVWYALRKSKIPSNHHKEIIKADFKGRKVPAMATMAEFDEALKKYGVKLA